MSAITWTRMCRVCRQSKPMAGGLTKNRGRWWCCEHCKPKVIEKEKAA